MAEVFKYVQGDTGPQLKLTLTDEDTGNATDLTGATVKMHFRAAGEDSVLFSKTLYFNPSTQPDGLVYVNWSAGELDQDAGTYEAEIEVDRTAVSGGTLETVYEKLKFKIREDFA